ncbi:hypothetical protein BH20BAC1_BH20BAC1_05780 [soil metagenome]
MKQVLVLVLSCFLFSLPLFAQVPAAMPPEADQFYNEAMPVVKEQVKSLIMKTAASFKNRNANADSLYKVLRTNNALKNLSEEQLKGLSALIMVQASKNADDDLKKMVLSMNNRNDKVTQKAQPQSEATPDAPDEKQLLLEMIMQHKCRIAEEVSLVIKTISSNKTDIISHLR